MKHTTEANRQNLHNDSHRPDTTEGQSDPGDGTPKLGHDRPATPKDPQRPMTRPAKTTRSRALGKNVERQASRASGYPAATCSVNVAPLSGSNR